MNQMFKRSIAIVTILGAFVGNAMGASLPAPFSTSPIDTDAFGNSAANLSGSFRVDGGPEQFRYFIGTNSGPGSLGMDFTTPFTDGLGNDFAVLTNSQAWGPLADTALFQFFLAGALQTSFTAHLAPDQLFEFDLPGEGIVADQVLITNITPDPPGINDLATMTFDNAGISYTVPIPAPIWLLFSGLVALFARVRIGTA